MIEIKLPIIVPIENLKPNPWNPNKVAIPEFNLLIANIIKNGFCFPLVVIEEGKNSIGEKTYMIVDGFHRHLAAKQLKMDKISVVVINGTINDLKSATIAFNRAKGTHNIDIMSKIVSEMVDSGMTLEEINKSLGMDKDESLRLSQNSGIASLFKDVEFNRAWL